MPLAVDRQPPRSSRKAARFTLEVFVDAPPSQVHAKLADLRNHVELHPLIHEVVELPRVPSQPDTQRVRLLERMKLGPFPLRFWYVATIRAESDHALVSQAWAFPRVHVHTRYTLSPEGSGTRLVEQAEITAPCPVLRYTARTAEAAHAATLERLASVLAPSTPKSP